MKFFFDLKFSPSRMPDFDSLKRIKMIMHLCIDALGGGDNSS